MGIRGVWEAAKHGLRCMACETWACGLCGFLAISGGGSWVWWIATSTGAAPGSAVAARTESQKNLGSQPRAMASSQIRASSQLTGSMACVVTCLGQGEGKMSA